MTAADLRTRASAAPRVRAGRVGAASGPARPTVAELFLPYQQRYILDRSTVVLWQKSRRVGADFCEAYRCVAERIDGTRTCDYWYSSADESAAVEFMQYVRMWARDIFGVAIEMVTGLDPYDHRDIKVMSVVLPEVNGRRPRITAMASNPKSFRSKGGDVCVSEFAFHDDAEALWKALAPVTMWGGRIRVISTHHGEDSKFCELIGQAMRHIDPETHGKPRKTDVRASLHTTTIHDAIADGLVERINTVTGQRLTREEFLANEQAKCSRQEVWDEEFECKPRADGDSYFKYELLRPVAIAETQTCWADGAFIAEVIRGAEGADCLYAGADIGRKSDLFAVWVLAQFGGMRRTIGVFAARDIRFAVMESVLHRLMAIESAGGVRRIAIDETGLGMQLAERMVEKYRNRAEAVGFTAAVKEDLVTTARRDIEERTVTLPDELGVLAEFNAFRKINTTAKNERYNADETSEGHSDRAVACMLALHAAKKPASRMRAVQVMGGAVA